MSNTNCDLFLQLKQQNVNFMSDQLTNRARAPQSRHFRSRVLVTFFPFFVEMSYNLGNYYL